MDDVLVLWDIDGTLLNAGGVGRDLYGTVFVQLFGRSLSAYAPMAGRTDRAIILETLTLAGVDEPRRHDAAPQSDFAFGVRVSHEADLELLQRRAEVLPDHVVNSFDLFEKLGRQRSVTNPTWSELAGIDVFGFAHGDVRLFANSDGPFMPRPFRLHASSNFSSSLGLASQRLLCGRPT